MKLKEAILKSIKEAVLQIEPEAKVILFGSRARDDARDESDWDVLIVTPHEADLKEEQRFRHKLLYVELEYGQAISTLAYSKDKWESSRWISPLYQSIKSEGIEL